MLSLKDFVTIRAESRSRRFPGKTDGQTDAIAILVSRVAFTNECGREIK